MAKVAADINLDLSHECVHLCQIYIDNPQEKGTLRLDSEGKPVLDTDGRLLFVEQP